MILICCEIACKWCLVFPGSFATILWALAVWSCTLGMENSIFASITDDVHSCYDFPVQNGEGFPIAHRNL